MKRKINVQFVAVSALAVVITAITSMLLFYNIFKNQVFDDIKAYAHVIWPLNQELWDGKDNQQWLERDGLRITLMEKDGKVIYDSVADENKMENHKNRPEVKEALEKGEGHAVRWSSTSSLHTLYYAEKMDNGQILRVGKESDNIFRIMTDTVCMILILSVLVVLLCVLLSHILTKRLLMPIEKLASNLDGVNQENIYEEIEPFIQTIREQHINILNSARIRQEFTANVSHELKTPLTAISGYAELIGSGMTDEKDTKRFAEEIHNNSDRLLTLINDIIKLSELDDEDLEFDFEQVDLYQIAQECLNMMKLQADKQDITLHLKGERCTVVANRSLLEELIYNLCSNAVRYNNRGGSVTITVESINGRVMLSVKDTGIGIPKEHQERIFERFYRVDKGRSKQSGGTGLGLAIVKHIVAQHNAEITLESEPGKGTEIRVLF